MNWTIRRFDEIDSTNRYLLTEAAMGAPAGTVAVARYQSAGRGRLDRSWVTVPGEALLFSVLLEPGHADIATRAMALAISDACPFPVGLKWPNDVLVEGRKLAGILAESNASGSISALAVGCGINVHSAPEGLEATWVGEWTEDRVDIEALLMRILLTLRARLQHPERIPGDFRGLCITLNKKVRVEQTGGITLEGIADDVSDNGALGLLLDSGRRMWVTAGDVYHLRDVG